MVGLPIKIQWEPENSEIRRRLLDSKFVLKWSSQHQTQQLCSVSFLLHNKIKCRKLLLLMSSFYSSVLWLSFYMSRKFKCYVDSRMGEGRVQLYMNSNALCSTYKDDKGNAKEWIVQSPKTKSSHLISTPETLFGDGKFLKENRKN